MAGGVEYQVTKVDPTNPETKGMVYQVNSVSEEVAATLGGKVYRARIIKDPSDPMVAGKVYQIVLIGDPEGPAVKGKVYNAILTGGSEAVVVGPAVSPLSLPDAVADSLEYLKAFGGTKQRNLPAEYTQLEYIESTGTQYIDTGYKPNDNTSIDIKFSTSSQAHFVFGSRKATSGTGQQRFCLYVGYNDFNPQYGNSNYSAVGLFVVSTVYQVQMNKNGFVVDGITERDFTSENFTGENNLILFGNNTNGTILSAENRIYYSKIYEDGTLVRNFIPAKRNSDNVLGMYDTVSQTFFTNAGTGAFIAGADVTVPSPDYPMDIVSNNGVLKLSPNLVDTSLATKGYYIDSSGNIAQSTNWAVSDYIPVTAGKQITVSGLTYSSTGARFNYYDSSKVKTETISYGNGTLTVPNNASYIRICYRWVDDEDTVCLNEGGSVRPLIADGTVETINIHGKNLFDKNDVAYNNSTILADGTIISAPDISVLDYIPVQPNTTYTYSSTTNSTRAYNKRMVCFDASKNYITSIADTTGNPSGPFSITGTTPANTKYVRVACSNDQMDTAQLEQGSTATTYEEYFDGGTATAEMLLKVGDYQDVQEVIAGDVTRNVGVKVLGGTEDWNVATSVHNGVSRNNFYTNFSDATGTGTDEIICSIASWAQTAVSDYSAPACRISSSRNFNIVPFEDTTTIPTVTAWKQYLADQYNAGTPVTVVYPLATPTTESVTGQALNVQQGDNIVEITQASLDGLELEAKYEKEGT